MDVEERLGNKLLYKLELCLLKIIPMVSALLYLANTVLSFYDIDLPILSYIGGYSLLPLLFMYLSSYVFKFCEYHRMFLHYIVVSDVLTQIDYYIGIPVSDRGLLSIHLSVAGISLFIILYLYVKHNKRVVSTNSGQNRCRK